jgi:hypothetical protein
MREMSDFNTVLNQVLTLTEETTNEAALTPMYCCLTSPLSIPNRCVRWVCSSLGANISNDLNAVGCWPSMLLSRRRTG